LHLMCRVERGFSVTIDEKYVALETASVPFAA